MFKRRTSASLALVLALAMSPAFAQQAKPDEHHPAATAGPAPQQPAGSSGMMGPGMMGQGMMGGGTGQMDMMSAMAGRVEGRIAFLKAELKITDAQLPAWNAVAEAMRANAKDMGTMSSGMMTMMSQQAPLPDKLAAREKLMSSRLDALRKLKTAVAPLYAGLSDDQKKTADELMAGPMGGDMMAGGMMGMSGGGMMGGSMMGGGTNKK